MRILQLISIFSLFASTASLHSSNFVEVCERDSTAGLAKLDYAIDAILEEAVKRRESLRYDVYQQIIKHSEKVQQEDAATTCPPIDCPPPQPTIFPPPFTLAPTTQPTKPPPTKESPTDTTNGNTATTETASSQANSDGSTASLTSAGSSTAAPPPMEEEEKREKREIEENPEIVQSKIEMPTTFFDRDPAKDPFNIYVNNLKKYLHKDSGACEKPVDEAFTTGSITWEQLFGFFSQLATVHPGPFCNLCERFADAIEKKILKPSPLLLTKEEVMMRKLLNAYFPSPRLLCAAIAPGCTDKLVLAKNATEIKEAEICLECTFCYSILNAIFHRILLDEHLMAEIAKFFHDSLFFNICADFCPIAQNAQPFFGSCFTMDTCQSFFDRLLKDIIRAVKVILKPERFCVLELGWCELGEQPNIMHCLRELCEAELGTTAPFGALCALIPDRPPDADAFINVKETKIYKQMKDYHWAYYDKFDAAKTEL